MSDLPIDDKTLDKWLGERDNKKERIRIQSKQVATYITSNEAFYDWFDELEGYHIREERFWDDCERGESGVLFEWLRAAFAVGYEAGRSSNLR